MKVIVTEDQKSYRQALANFFIGAGIDVIAEAANGLELLHCLQVKSLKPDIIVVDLEMPLMDGAEAIIRIRKFDKRVKIMMLTFFTGKELIAEMKKNGANVFMDKNNDLQDILSMLNQLYTDDNPIVNATNYKSKFTKTEKDIIQLIAKGKTTAEIALLRNRSIKSIEAHKRNIYDKTGCQNIADFKLYCKNEGLVYLGK